MEMVMRKMKYKMLTRENVKFTYFERWPMDCEELK